MFNVPPGAANHPLAPWNMDDPPYSQCGKDVDDCKCPACEHCELVGVKLTKGLCDDCFCELYAREP